MAQYQIVGIEHMKGTSKKSGKDYDMDILHVIDCSPPRNANLTGNRVDKITVSRDTGLLVRPPQPGEVYDIGFTRFGYVDYIDPVKK